MNGGTLARFAIAEKERKWVWANAVSTEDLVVCTLPDVPNPVAVRYVFTMKFTGAIQ